MSRAVISVSLKIPDNEAYTALVTLQRLGIDVKRLVRSEIFLLECVDESIFNPNKHVLRELAVAQPQPGECWVEEIDALRNERTRRYVAWRLFDEHAQALARPIVEEAARLLLCNPAIEKAHFAS